MTRIFVPLNDVFVKCVFRGSCSNLMKRKSNLNKQVIPNVSSAVTTQKEGHTIGEEKRRHGEGRDSRRTRVCVGVCTVILSSAAEDFNLIFEYRWNTFAIWFIDLVCASDKSIHQTTAYTTMPLLY